MSTQIISRPLCELGRFGVVLVAARRAARLMVVGTLSFALVLLVAPSGARAAMPAELSVQGTLATSAGGVPAPGQYSLSFRLYETVTGGAPVYTQAAALVEVSAGLFDTVLGPLPDGLLETHPVLWLETRVGTESLPRSLLRPVPFALVARSATTAAHADDVTCTGCISAASVDFPWAAGVSEGGAAADLTCTGCVGATDLGTGSVGTAHIQDGSITASDLSFPYAGSLSKGGPALALACTGCVTGVELAPNLALAGNVTVSGSLGACIAGADGCAVKVGDKALASRTGGWLNAEVAGGLRVRNADNTGWRSLEFGSGAAYGGLAVGGGNLTVTGNVGAGTVSPQARLHVVGSSILDGAVTLTGPVGVGTSTPAATLDVNGGIKAGGSVQLGDDQTTCTAGKSGALRWSGAAVQVCDGTAWVALGSGGSGSEPIARSCQGVIEAGKSVGDGVYWIDPNGGPDGDAFPAYCDMTTDGGGWTLLLNLDTGDAKRHDYDDTTFWASASTEGEASNGLFAGLKSKAWSQLSGATQLMVEVHNNGAKVGDARYTIRETYQSLTFMQLMNDASDAVLTSPKLAGTGATAITQNASFGPPFGDLFVDHGEPLVINKQSGWGAQQNYTRIATLLDGSGPNTTHVFAGLGIRHFNNTWGVYTEAAPITPYCPAGAMYGNASNFGAVAGSSNTIMTHSTCPTAITWFPYDTAIFARDKALPTANDGSAQDKAALSASDLLALGEDQDGLYWIDPNGGSPADAMQVFVDLNTNGQGWAVASSCLDLLQRGLSTGSGVYMIDPTTPTTGEHRFLTWCDMTTAGGGWTMVLNLDSRDGVRHHYDDTAFWTTATGEGAASTAMTSGFKSGAYASFPRAAEVMVYLHNDTAKLGHATYSLLPAYQNRSLLWMVTNLVTQTVTGARTGAAGTVGATVNSSFPTTVFGDIFVDHAEPMVINKQGGWTDGLNQNRIATTLSGPTNTPHTFAGLGGRHYRAGWSEYYESAPITPYCPAWYLYGAANNYQAGPSASYTIEGNSSGCASSLQYLPVDTAVFVREAVVYGAPANGSSQQAAAPSCSAALAAGASLDGTYWVDPNGGSTADAFEMFCDMTTNGGGWGVAADCKDMLAKGLSIGSGVYMIDPLTPATGANRFFAWCDMATEGGGWTLLFNLDTGDSARHDYNDTAFWTGTGTEGTPWTALKTGNKGKAYASLTHSSELLVYAHSGGALAGYAVYDIVGAYKDKSFQWLTTNLSDGVLTGARKTGFGATGVGANPQMTAGPWGDPFVEHTEPVVINRQSGFGAAQNLTRVGTTFNTTNTPHTFAGMGVRHANTSWGVYAESAPITPYCPAAYFYGTGTNYGLVPGYTYQPLSYPSNGCLTSGYQFLPIDTAVYFR